MRYRNILLIDDDEDDHEIFRAALDKVGGFNCTTLDNAQEALDRLKEGALQTDLIFLDLNMPVMNGEQFLREIKQDQDLNVIPVVILSTSSQRVAIEHTRALGAQGFFSKPDKFDDWITMLRSVVV
jgi:CheY-like chemotaxis protein